MTREADDSDGLRFPTGLPEGDRGRWAGMTVEQRRRAACRLAAFRDWISGKIELDEAVVASGLSRSRFYRLAADWKAAPCLASLGAFVGSGASRQRLDPAVVNALQAVVADVVALNEGASVAQLVRQLVLAAGVEQSKLPGTIRLRQIVEDEQRRVAATGEAGSTVMFDCTAINLPRAGGRPHVMFAVVDKGTRLVLGTAIARSADVELGYRMAAADARKRIAVLAGHIPWALRTSQILLVAGSDLEASTALRERLIAGGVRSNVTLARVPKRFGRYFRAVVGQRIGRIALTPGRTETGHAMSDNDDMKPWSEDEATAAVTAAVNHYNERILEDAPVSDRRTPEDLDRALVLLAGPP